MIERAFGDEAEFGEGGREGGDGLVEVFLKVERGEKEGTGWLNLHEEMLKVNLRRERGRWLTGRLNISPKLREVREEGR